MWKAVNSVVSSTRLDFPDHPRWLINLLLALAFGLPTAVMCLAVAQPWWAVGDLLRDPLIIAQKRMEATGAAKGCCSIEVGAISFLGNLVMTGAAAVMFFSALLRQLTFGRFDGAAALLVLGGLLCSIMVLDDLYRLHESTKEMYFYVLYTALISVVGLLSLIWLGPFELRFLFSTLAFLAISAVVDIKFSDQFGEFRIVIEDGAKFFGFCSFVAFAIAAGIRLGAPGLPRA